MNFLKRICRLNQSVILSILLLLVNYLGLAQCNASFVFTVGLGGNVSFLSTSSPTLSGTNYKWEFGDGNTFVATNGTAVTTSHSYSANGVYLASLSFTTGACSDTVYQYIMVNSVSSGTCLPNTSLTVWMGSNVTNTFFSTSTNTNSSTSFSWIFGDGSTGNGSVSPHTYASPSVYTVYLTASNGGTACIHNASMVVTAGLVDYSYSSTGFNSFTLNSISAPSNTNSFYSWNFGNGQPTFTAQGTPTAAITYTSNGAYPVTLTFGNTNPPYGNSATKTLVVTSFTNPTTCNLNANFVSNQFNSGINFFNISTGTYSGTVFNWSFGDNTFSTTTSPVHTYSASGIYTVQLFAYNPAFSASCSSVYSTTVSVCSLSINAVSQPSAGVFNFTATAAPNPTNANYSWNFGNGNTNQGTNLTSVSNSYSNAGIYTVTCYLSNPANSCSVTASTTVNASCSLLAGFNYTAGANGQVTFVSSSTGTNGSTTYTWNFGDGSPTATGSAISHTYLANGTYTVSLFANSGGGCSSFTTIPIAIVNSNTCAASFTYNNLGGNSISFTSTSSGVNGSTTYSWNFGNGTTYSTTGTPTAVCNYTASGSYVVILSINTPSNGCNTTFSQVVTVSSGPCNLLAGFVTNTLAPNSFSFINVSTGTLSSTSYTWDFGDGGFSFGQNASHSYSTTGQFTVQLYASNNTTVGPCHSDTSMVVNSSYTCNIFANFSHTVGSGGTVSFSNTSTMPNSFNINRTWNFGNGVISHAVHPTVTYYNAGSYLVTLKLQDSIMTGCFDSIAQYINVTGILCTAVSNFTMLPGGSAGQWYAIPGYPWNVTAASWNWGDGSTTDSLYTVHQYSSSGTYSICLTVTTSCGASSSFCLSQFLNKGQDETAAIQYVNVIPPPLGNGVPELYGDISYSFYPNPNTGSFLISWQGQSNQDLTISVYNLLGSCVYQEAIRPVGSEGHHAVNLPEQPNGVYLLVLRAGNRSLNKRMIIAH